MAKYAIVSGGARGLGLGIVNALLEDGVVDVVAVIDKELAPPPAGIAARVRGFAADVTDQQQVHGALENITRELGAHPQVLCNNAGGGERVWWEGGRHNQWDSVEVWRRFVELNLNSVYIVSREVVPQMVRSGAICNTASIAGMLPAPFIAAYAAAKAGVISYTRSLALQLGPQGIRVNAVALGLIYTQIWQDLGTVLGGASERARASFEKTVQRLVPLGREQTPEDVGAAVSWLCSERACNVTGQILAVDGGIVLGTPPRRT